MQGHSKDTVIKENSTSICGGFYLEDEVAGTFTVSRSIRQ